MESLSLCPCMSPYPDIFSDLGPEMHPARVWRSKLLLRNAYYNIRNSPLSPFPLLNANTFSLAKMHLELPVSGLEVGQLL